MKKIASLLFTFFLFAYCGFAQKNISEKSEVKKFKMTAQFEKQDFPPNLYVDLKFNDDNGDGILETEEEAELLVCVSNRGKGIAQGLQVVVKSEKYDVDISFDAVKEILYLYPGKSVNLVFNLRAGLVSESQKHRFSIQVKEQFGFDTDEAFLTLNTLKYQPPEIVFSGYEIIDSGEGTAAINQDGLLQAGEKILLKCFVQNIGQGSAINAFSEISTTNQNVYLSGTQESLGDLAIGEVKTFIVGINPNKRVDDNVNLMLSVNVDKEVGSLESFKLKIPLNQLAPEPVVLNVEANLQRLQNQIARFEYTSNKFSANIGTIERIDEAPMSKTKRENSIGVVIGIEFYENIPSAPYAENDAKIMADYFKNTLGLNKVITFKSIEATGLFFDDVFNAQYGELQKEIIKGETEVFVFYSGHGLPSKNGERAYLFPSDGRLERLTTQGFNLNDFYNNLDALGAKSITVFMDACFSGGSKTSINKPVENLMSMKGVTIKPKTGEPWLNNPNFTVFSSSQASETSLAFDESRTGLFTYYLCLGLKGNADLNSDKYITADELQNYISLKVQETSKKILGVQTPQFNGDEKSVIVKY